jgi:hypothetical protein
MNMMAAVVVVEVNNGGGGINGGDGWCWLWQSSPAISQYVLGLSSVSCPYCAIILKASGCSSRNIGRLPRTYSIESLCDGVVVVAVIKTGREYKNRTWWWWWS